MRVNFKTTATNTSVPSSGTISATTLNLLAIHVEYYCSTS